MSGRQAKLLRWAQDKRYSLHKATNILGLSGSQCSTPKSNSKELWPTTHSNFPWWFQEQFPAQKRKKKKTATMATFFSQLYSDPSHFYFWKWRWKIIFRVWFCVERACSGYPLCDISVAVTVSSQTTGPNSYFTAGVNERGNKVQIEPLKFYFFSLAILKDFYPKVKTAISWQN